MSCSDEEDFKSCHIQDRGYWAAHGNTDLQLLPSSHSALERETHAQVAEMLGYDGNYIRWNMEEFQCKLDQLMWYWAISVRQVKPQNMKFTLLSFGTLYLLTYHGCVHPITAWGLLFPLGLLSSTWCLSDMSNSMCLSLRSVCLGAMVCLVVHSPNLSLHSSYMIIPIKRLAYAQPFLTKNAAALNWGVHRACTKPLAYSPLVTWSWCTFLNACVVFLVLWGDSAHLALEGCLLLFSFICWGWPLSTVGSCCAMVCYQALGPFRLTRWKQCDCAGWASSHTSYSLGGPASLWTMSPSATRMFTSRGTSHCHYPFCSFPTACETFLTAKCTFTVVTGSPALQFQYTGGVSCLTFLPAAPPPVHLWVSCKVISWCHHSRMFHLLPSTLGGGSSGFWIMYNSVHVRLFCK